MIIGICGKSGAGKTTVANMIREMTDRKVIHVEIDKIGHNVLSKPELKSVLVEAFEEAILNGDVVDRKKVGEIVFNSREKMNDLADITWNEMQKDLDKIIATEKTNIIILDWLLLPKTKYFNMCDIRVLLDVPYEIRKARAIKRDNITEVDFDLREKATIEYQSEEFDYVIKDSVKESVRKMVSRL